MRLRIYFGKGWCDLISQGRKRGSLKLKWNLRIFPSFLNSDDRGLRRKRGTAHRNRCAVLPVSSAETA